MKNYNNNPSYNNLIQEAVIDNIIREARVIVTITIIVTIQQEAVIITIIITIAEIITIITIILNIPHIITTIGINNRIHNSTLINNNNNNCECKGYRSLIVMSDKYLYTYNDY